MPRKRSRIDAFVLALGRTRPVWPHVDDEAGLEPLDRVLLDLAREEWERKLRGRFWKLATSIRTRLSAEPVS